MAQLGIRDKNYRPNQYINPMLISGGREPNPEDRPYRIFDKTNPEHPDYEGNKDDDDGPEFEQLSLPLVKGKKNQNMTIANIRPQDFIPFTPATRDNDGFAMPYLRTPELREEEMRHFLRFIENYRDGMVQRNTPMMVAKKKKDRKAVQAYKDFVKDSQGMGITESFKDLRRGQDGEGLDILNDLLDLDEV